MDVKRTFPIKRWGHGIWHILTALASGLLFEGIYLTA
jgi:predicted membrane channel-forming protein YqfA (hemolysin III family)